MKKNTIALALCALILAAPLYTVATSSADSNAAAPCFIFDELIEIY